VDAFDSSVSSPTTECMTPTAPVPKPTVNTLDVLNQDSLLTLTEHASKYKSGQIGCNTKQHKRSHKEQQAQEERESTADAIWR
jgi:hypothetical protein